MPQHPKEDATLSIPLDGNQYTSGVGISSNVAFSTGPRHMLAGRYELIGLIGVGAMGTVYRARDVELEEVVALKMLRRAISESSGMSDRFRREVRLARKVTHPNVARVFDIGEHGGDKFLTMEFIEGESLAALLAREGRLSVPRTLEILGDVCAGLSAVHRVGVIHRDLKPDNVLLARDGRAVLSDFGIARALSQEEGEAGKSLGTIVGTPAYMAPEQVQGAQDIDARCDIYALGAMVYEMLTGERAWRGDEPLAVASARLVADPPDPRIRRHDLPDAVARTVLRCMARAREARFASVELVVQELSSLTVPAPPPSSVAPPKPPTAESGDKLVAVLPFRNQGPASDAYIAEELTDDLIDTLSMTRGLKVRPRGVVARWKGGDHDPRAVGHELGVQVVVEGSVRRRDGAVRISARLISVADGFQLWAKRFDRPESEVLRINHEVAASIAEALTLEASAPCGALPNDPVAVDLYVRGRHEYRKFWGEPVQRAISLFEQALAREPRNPMILAAYALARARLWFFTNQGGEVAEQAAVSALATAPELADARLAMAAVHLQRANAVAAVRELKRALRINPAHAEAMGLLAYILLEIGFVDEGIRRAEAALALEPDAPLVLQALSRTCTMLGLDDRAETLLHQITANGRSNHYVLLVRFAMWRRDEERIKEIQKEISAQAVSLQARSVFDLILQSVLVHRRPPFHAEDTEMNALLVGTTRRLAFFRQLQAECAGYLGDVDGAISAIEHSVQAELIDLFWLERCPLLGETRADPRFVPLYAEVKRRADAIVAAYFGAD